LIKYFSDFCYVDQLQRHLRSKSKVVKNRAEFWTFFALQIFLGRAPKGHTLPAGHVEKFREVIFTSAKVIGTHMLNYKPNFKYSPLKILADLVPLFVVCSSKPWSNSSAYAQHPQGPKYIVSRTSRFGWVPTHMYFLDRGRKFTGLVSPNAGENHFR